MARLARIIVAVNIAHRVTQRGNARQFILASEAERSVYLELLQRFASFEWVRFYRDIHVVCMCNLGEQHALDFTADC